MKRVIVATVSGVFFGFVCFGLASSSPGSMPLPVVLQIIASRTLIGFAIGISSLSLGHWSVHGAPFQSAACIQRSHGSRQPGVNQDSYVGVDGCFRHDLWPADRAHYLCIF